MLVGEIRDLETAENAIQASLTGHLVFSTLHTNDAAERLHAADRHGRRAVPGGQHGRSRDGPAAGAHAVHEVPRGRIEPKRDDLPKDFPWDELQSGGKPLFRPQGCRGCRQLGLRGRQGIFELCVTTDAVRQLAHDRASSWEIRKAARADGMRTLREDAWLKVLDGMTTVDEVLRVTKGDRIVDGGMWSGELRSR